MLRIDGSIGGGGHAARVALSLAAACQTEVEIVRVGASHRPQGLRGDTLAVARAIAEVSNGRVEGDPGADTVRVFPGRPEPGSFELHARDGAHPGSATLVLQAVIPVLAMAGGRSEVVVHGVTHGAGGPTGTYLQTVFAPTARKLGVRVEVATARWAWAPDGVGELRARVSADAIIGVELPDRGEMLQIGGSAVASGLEHGTAERELHRVNRRLQEVGRSALVNVDEVATDSPGGMVFLLAVCERAIAGFTAIARDRVTAEQMADDAVNELFAYITSYALLDKHMADQFLVLAAIADGVTRFTAAEITPQLLATAEVARQVAGARVTVDGASGCPGEVEVTGVGGRS